MSRAQPCIPRLHLPTPHLRNRPEISRLRPKQTVLAAAGIRRIPLSPDPALLPSPPLLGVSRVTAVQIHLTISCSVRAGSTRQTVPRNRPPRCGFTQQSKRDRSATWWPRDIHNRPSVHLQATVKDDARSFDRGNGFIGTQTHIPSKFSFTSDCGHFKYIRFKKKDIEIPKFLGGRPPRF